MKISADHGRRLGATGLTLPPIVFGTAALANRPEVIPEQRKLAICGEWFQQVEPPAFVDVSYEDGEGMALEVLARLLRRLDVSGEEVVVHLSVDAARIEESWEKSCRLLGDDYRPRLVTVVDAAGEAQWVADELKSAANVVGVGVGCMVSTAEFTLPASADWVLVDGGLSMLEQSPEMLRFLAGLAERGVPVIASGVFGGGFLVGGTCLNGRVISADDPANRSLLAWRTAFVALCHGHGISPAHACIQFALSLPGVVAVKVISSHPDRVAGNAEAAVTKVPDGFWASMKEEGLLSAEFPFRRLSR
jgi:D-threo-aldose 1-dehydrogenase